MDTAAARTTPPRLAFRIDEAARVLGISRATLYRLIKDRQLSVVKIGARTLVTRTELQRLLDEGAEPPGAAMG